MIFSDGFPPTPIAVLQGILLEMRRVIFQTAEAMLGREVPESCLLFPTKSPDIHVNGKPGFVPTGPWASHGVSITPPVFLAFSLLSSSPKSLIDSDGDPFSFGGSDQAPDVLGNGFINQKLSWSIPGRKL